MLVAIFLFFLSNDVFGWTGDTFCVYPVSTSSSKCPFYATCNISFDQLIDPLLSNITTSYNDATFYFLHGTYYLSSTMTFHHSINLQFQGEGEMTKRHTVMESPVVIIDCFTSKPSAAIIFNNCTNVSLANITFKSCRGRSFNHFSLYFTESSTISIEYMSFQNYTVALSLQSSYNYTIAHSSFYSNSHAINIELKPKGPELYNVVVVKYCNMTDHNIIAIQVLYQSSAMMWAKIKMEKLFIEKSSSGIFFSKTDGNGFIRPNIQLDLNRVVVTNSNCNIEVNAFCDHFNMTVNHLNSSKSSFGLYILAYSKASHIAITNSSFYNNNQTGIRLEVAGNNEGTFSLDSSQFRNNSGLFGTSLQAVIGITNQTFNISISKVKFENNKINQLFVDNYNYSEGYAMTVGIANCMFIAISECTFSNNEGSGLALFNSRVFFHGVNNFSNNTAYRGGGIVMFANSYSYLYLMPDAHLSFINNNANNAGGAIFVEQNVLTLGSDTLSFTSCFYQFSHSDEAEPVQHFYFKNNTAAVAGSVLYGGATEGCLIEGTIINYSFLKISKFVDQSRLSMISSDPLKVCFCKSNAVPNCSQIAKSISVRPGEPVTLLLAIAGQHNNLTTGIIKVHVFSEILVHRIPKANCTTKTIIPKFIVHNSSTSQVDVNITIGNPAAIIQITPITVTLNKLQCLPGTSLDSNNGVCECDLPSNFNCIGYDAQVTKEDQSWIAAYSNTINTCMGTIVCQFCPYDYCVQSKIKFTLSDPDKQCADNRSGLLCGKCDVGLSLMLGSNKCGECTNDYIALIIPFSLAGVALVILLIVLNLTVAVGTVNGLLFFANIIRIYNPLFHGISNIPVLRLFISWINLDLGIETCFFDGLNSFYKNLLQFVFPLYLWILILLIILLSQKFSKFSQKIGNNSVPVLCTLLLLSYTKLLRTVISICIYARPSNCSGVLWYNDATEPYLRGYHLGLFIIALVAIIGLFLPYVSFLLFFPLWELCRSKWTIGTSVYLKLKPFFDAYAGPHSERFRIWPGLLLVARSVIAITVAVRTNHLVTIGITVAVIVILLVTMSFDNVYKSKSIHLIDVSYLFCLLIILYVLTGALSGSSDTLDDAKKGMTVMLSLSFVGFLCILVYHLYNLPFFKKYKVKLQKTGSVLPTAHLKDVAGDKSFSSITAPTRSELTMSNLREPLLEDELQS